jgi:succinate dehydrogenase/fumarate reductase iron-sulfur protein
MKHQREITITVVRTNPETGMKPREVKYTIPYSDRMRVMDALNYVRENIDSSLAFRWSCRYYAKCGTCAAMINGKPGLTCYEPVVDGMVVAPLANFPVIRDLVVDRREWDKRVNTELRGIIASEVSSKKKA